MKLNRLYYLAATVLAATLMQNASAQIWTGGGVDTLWSDTANWDTGVVPGPNCTNAVFGTAIPNNVVVTVTNGEVENVGTANGANIFGPQWGSTLNIYGTLNWGFIMVPVQFDPNAQRSVINMYAGSSMGSTWGGDTLLLGDAWFTGQPYVTMNMYGNSYANYQYLGWGGHLNLYDNSTNVITTFVLVGTTAGNWGLAGPSDLTRQINVAGGTLILPTGNAVNVGTWIQRGIFVAYGKQFDTADINIVDDGSATTVTVPALGTLQNVAMFAPRTNMMTGTFMNIAEVGNFTGFSGAHLDGVDAAQRGSGAITYLNSNPNVASVSTNGNVIALAPGTTTVSGTFGAMNTTNSIVITVTPFTNSLVHRYSFSETGGATTADSVGGAPWAGTLNGGASLGGGQVALDGSSGFVQLPAGLVSGMDAVTIDAWATIGTPAAFAALYAFGDQDANFSPQGQNYLAFQPYTAGNTANALFGPGDPGFANEQDAAMPLVYVANGPTNYLTSVHVTVVYHPYANFVDLYTNGVLVAAQNNVTMPLASTLGADPINFLGQSLYGTDPFLNGSIDELRIYNGPLTAGQINAENVLGPDQLLGTSRNVTMSAASSGSNLVIKWPTSSALNGLLASPTLGAGAVWTPVNGTLTTDGSGNFMMTVPSSTGTQFYRLQQ